MIHILYGADSFSLKERLDAIRGSLGNSDLMDFSTQRLDGASLTPEYFASVCQAMPFMVARRLVMVEGLLSRFTPVQVPPAALQQKDILTIVRPAEAGAGARSEENISGNKKPWIPFVNVVNNVPESTLLVLVDGELKGRNLLLAELSSKAKIEVFSPLKGDALFDWVRNRSATYRCLLAPEAINHLIDMLGNNLWVIDSELQKLSLFAQDQPVKIPDIDHLVSYSRGSNIFQLVDAVLQRRIKRALEVYQQLQDAGAEPPYVLAMLAREIRRLLLAKLMAAGRTLPEDLVRDQKLFDEKSLRILSDKARKYSQPALEELYHRILKTDVAIKTGKAAPAIAMETLIGAVCEQTPAFSPGR